ncbi:MAG: HAMP domain-containing histidine kinase [Vallitalea sp.]|nr:HAMP domain-containing histidine kinase [Vallitalea sp.]
MDTNSKNNTEEIDNIAAIKDKDINEYNVIGDNENQLYNEDNNYESGNDNNNLPTKKRISISKALVTFSIILLLAILSVSSYVPIKENVISNDDTIRNYVESTEFTDYLARYTQYLIKSEIEEKVNYYIRFRDVTSINYYISNDNINKSNVTGGINFSDMVHEKMHIKVTIDEDRDYKIENKTNYKIDENRFISDLNNWLNEEYNNISIIFIINNDIENYNDSFTHEINHYNAEIYAEIILVIGIVTILLLIIIAFSIKFSYQKQTSICKIFNSMYLEIKILLWAIVFNGFVFGLIRYDISYLIDLISETSFNYYLIGISFVFTLLTLIYLSIVYIKYIYYNGIIEGVIKNSLIGKVSIYIVKKINRVYNNMINIDVREKDNRKIFLLIGIHSIVILIITVTDVGLLSLALALTYTVIIFKYLFQLINNVRVLNEGSSQLSQGNFDIRVEEEIGILTPIAKNINNINSGFRVAVDNATKSQKMKTELISNVSHDLKTPLTSIITYIDLLKSGEINKKTQNEYIDILDKKAKRLNVLIEDLFEASKASSGNIDLQMKEIDVIALFKQTLGELEEKINNSSLIMKISMPEDKIMCLLDGRRTYRVFDNIVSNIVKYSMNKSRVYIDIQQHEKEVKFIFKNIASYEMNFDASEITERFTRGDKARNTEGSGLGLSIAKSLVELQNGKLSISIDGDLFKLIVSFPTIEEN